MEQFQWSPAPAFQSKMISSFCFESFKVKEKKINPIIIITLISFFQVQRPWISFFTKTFIIKILYDRQGSFLTKYFTYLTIFFRTVTDKSEGCLSFLKIFIHTSDDLGQMCSYFQLYAWSPGN